MEYKKLREQRRIALEKIEYKTRLKEQKFKEKTIKKYGEKAIKKFEKSFVSGRCGMYMYLGCVFFSERIDILCNYLNSLYPSVNFYHEIGGPDISWIEREGR